MIIPRAIPASLLCLAAGLLPLACKPTPKDRIALVGATVIDGSGGRPQPDMVVVVHGTRIETVASRADFEIPKTALVVDVSGRWILPGLIDAHAHSARWALSRYLAYGVTTIRDVHSTQDSIMALREQAANGAILSPRIYAAGAMIDGSPATYSDATAVTNEDEARRAVDARVVAGVDLIKVYTRITPVLLKAITDEANTFHVRVAAHLGLTDAVTAGKLGVRSIEHLSGVPEAALSNPAPLYAAHRQGFFAGWNAFERSWAGLDSAALDRVAVALADTRVFLVPTLVLHDTYSRLDDPALINDPGLKAVPDSEQVRWNVPELKARAGWKDADYAAFRKSRPVQDLFIREFRSAGGSVVTGTDASNQMIVPGLSEHLELELLVEAGLTPSDALLAATRNAASLIGADSLGTIAPGKLADLVVIGGDPLQDIRNTRKVEQVMIRGRLLPTDSLRSTW
jgi:imidazolonepropionase-like amidohydrolase